MRKFFAVALGSVVALVGFAGSAKASATVDLIWIDVTDTAGNGVAKCLFDQVMGTILTRNCPLDPRSSNAGHTISGLDSSANITLAVVLTAGLNGSIGGGVSVDYGDALPKLSVANYQSFITSIFLPSQLGTTTDTGTFIDNVNSAAFPFLQIPVGLGLSAGQSAYLGTISFHKDLLVNGTFDIIVGTNGPGGTDDVLDGDGNTITGTTTFNSAELINVPEPGALSLLVMGLGGMLLAGRGRRS